MKVNFLHISLNKHKQMSTHYYYRQINFWQDRAEKVTLYCGKTLRKVLEIIIEPKNRKGSKITLA
jgi:hypothetical protein